MGICIQACYHYVVPIYGKVLADGLGQLLLGNCSGLEGAIHEVLPEGEDGLVQGYHTASLGLVQVDT